MLPWLQQGHTCLPHHHRHHWYRLQGRTHLACKQCSTGGGLQGWTQVDFKHFKLWWSDTFSWQPLLFSIIRFSLHNLGFWFCHSSNTALGCEYPKALDTTFLLPSLDTSVTKTSWIMIAVLSSTQVGALEIQREFDCNSEHFQTTQLSNK
jgi:hypothetical protein